MFIELTDHLRCPADHEEAFLVLIPERMEGRRVMAGHLGCPACGWGTAWSDGVPDFGGIEEAGRGPAPFDAEAALALLGLDGPGGWVAFAGRAGTLAHAFTILLPNVNIVAVNPPAAVPSHGTVSVIRSAVWPIKKHSMRGVVLGADAADLAEQAIRSVLPGLHAAGDGPPPSLGIGDQLVGQAPGAWVVRKG